MKLPTVLKALSALVGLFLVAPNIAVGGGTDGTRGKFACYASWINADRSVWVVQNVNKYGDITLNSITIYDSAGNLVTVTPPLAPVVIGPHQTYTLYSNDFDTPASLSPPGMAIFEWTATKDITPRAFVIRPNSTASYQVDCNETRLQTRDRYHDKDHD